MYNEVVYRTFLITCDKAESIWDGNNNGSSIIDSYVSWWLPCWNGNYQTEQQKVSIVTHAHIHGHYIHSLVCIHTWSVCMCCRCIVFHLPLMVCSLHTFPTERRYMTIPNDHQSTDMLYGCPDNISGAVIEIPWAVDILGK